MRFFELDDVANNRTFNKGSVADLEMHPNHMILVFNTLPIPLDKKQYSFYYNNCMGQSAKLKDTPKCKEISELLNVANNTFNKS